MIPWIIGTSRLLTACPSSEPTPGSENDSSTRIEPEISAPRTRPDAVTIGTSALRRAYVSTTVGRDSPRARANRIASRSSSRTIAARVTFTTRAITDSDSASAGSSRCWRRPVKPLPSP